MFNSQTMFIRDGTKIDSPRLAIAFFLFTILKCTIF